MQLQYFLGILRSKFSFPFIVLLRKLGFEFLFFYEDVLKVAVEMTPRISLLFARKEARHHGTIKTKDFS
jgi:hypothetical protein